MHETFRLRPQAESLRLDSSRLLRPGESSPALSRNLANGVPMARTSRTLPGLIYRLSLIPIACRSRTVIRFNLQKFIIVILES